MKEKNSLLILTLNLENNRKKVQQKKNISNNDSTLSWCFNVGVATLTLICLVLIVDVEVGGIVATMISKTLRAIVEGISRITLQ